MRRLPIFLASAALASAQIWQPQQSGTTVSLRGISAVNTSVAWASGAKGTFLKTSDGGKTWLAAAMPGAADLDFRDVEAMDERTVYLLSSGKGPASRIYKTTNAGERWSLLYTNPQAEGFLDCMAFWDATHGIVVGDPVNGRFTILTTSDGLTWLARKGPSAQKGEGAFAASGSCVFTRGTREVWFGTGGTGGSRVFHSTDGGDTWSVATTPIRHDSESAGIFSVAFSGALHGVIAGGDYMKPGEGAGNLAITEDGGKTWSAPAAATPAGYRSAVAYLAERKLWIAAGTSGSESSADGGRTWKEIDKASYNAISGGWAVGPNGAIAALNVP